MIIVAGSLTVAADERQRYLDAVEQVTREARRAPGCLDFVQSADLVEPTRIVIYERWSSEEDLHRFRSAGDPAKAAPAELPQVVAADVAKYRVAAVEAP
ncbi:putative quinol monooxygenase [Nocardioides sp. SYSU DS0651]|uniref:putative quinol monooxygenase n=1 Tax=Nocardioides sp. SYSU DS0651 TaxID=3415955 RepID=UPI003F4C4128